MSTVEGNLKGDIDQQNLASALGIVKKDYVGYKNRI